MTTSPEPESLDTITLSVPGMTCGHCEAAVRRELGGVSGVRTVEVDLDRKLVTVAGTALARPDLVEAIDEAGFDVA